MSFLRPSPLFAAGYALALGLCAPACKGQISLPTAVDLALQNNPKVQIAETDLARAQAVLSESRDVFVPAVSASGGVGRAAGAPLSPPVVFSVAAQSLVYNFSQPDYIRAAHSGVSSAQLALQAARTDVAEDVTSTYIGLDNTLQRKRALAEGLDAANRLVSIVEDRFNAGIDPHVEVTRAHRTAAQIRLQVLQADDEAAGDAEHLATLTGLPAAGWVTAPASIPKLEPPSPAAEAAQDEVDKLGGTSAAFETARARAYTAHGEARYLFRPQLSFSVQYSKLSDAFTSYDFYYPGFRERIVCNPICSTNGTLNSFNSLSVGVQLTLPLLDMVHRARAREAAIDAQRSLLDAEVQQHTFLENHHHLLHDTKELAARAELATLDHDLALDQLETVAVRLRADAANAPGEQMTPKDQANAQLAERQRTVDMLEAELQLQRAELSLLRQRGSLATWLAATIPGTPSAPANAPQGTSVSLPPTVGVSPGMGSPSGTPPTTGSTPSSLPTAPDANPAPASPAPPPTVSPSTPHR